MSDKLEPVATELEDNVTRRAEPGAPSQASGILARDDGEAVAAWRRARAST